MQLCVHAHTEEVSTWKYELLNGHGSVCEERKGIFSLSLVMAFPPYAIKGEEGAPFRGSPFYRFEVER